MREILARANASPADWCADPPSNPPSSTEIHRDTPSHPPLVATGGAFRGAPRKRRGAPRERRESVAERRGPLKPLWEHLKSATVPRHPDATGPFFLRRLRVIAKSLPYKLTAGTSGRRATAARFLISYHIWRRVRGA